MSTRNLKPEVEPRLAEGNFVKVAGAERAALTFPISSAQALHWVLRG